MINNSGVGVGVGVGVGCSDAFGKIIEHVGQQRAMGYHNVLCDNYENVQNARYKESKVYVTKEEMERQRLMELLRKGDYELAKAVSDDKTTFIAFLALYLR